MDNQNNTFDFPEGMMYNSTQQDAINEAVAQRYADSYLSRVEIIKMDEQKPLGDTKCRHETLIPDPDDVIGEALYHGCSNPKCGVGFYIQPTKK